MIVAIIISFVAVLFAYWGKNNNNWLVVSFVLITLFQGLRYDFGSDYMDYYIYFKEVNTNTIDILNIDALKEYTKKNEIGWVIINVLCKPIGYFGMVLLLAVFENRVIYKAIKKYVPSNMYWGAVACYVFSATLFLIGACSMYRQWLAVILFLIAIKYIEQNKPIKYFILLAVAISIHSSAWILIPAYFIRFVPKINMIPEKMLFFAFVFYYIWTFYAPSLVRANMESVLGMEEFQHYRYYQGAVQRGSSSLIGMIDIFISQAVIPGIVIMTLPKLNNNLQKIALLFPLYLLFVPLSTILSMLSRLNYYFLIFGIIAIPIAIDQFYPKRKYIAYMIFFAYLLFAIKAFLALQHGSSWVSYQEYSTIFQVPWE